MEHRHLGRSGLKVSEIAYGNWLTHGSQVEEDAALACVAAALDEGITTFDTADAYAETKAELVLGRALRGVRRESVEICTKVFWPTGPGANDRGLSRKHVLESAHASLRRLQTDEILAKVQQLKPLAAAAGLTLAQLAVAWTLQNPAVSAAIVGATRPEQVRENAQAGGVRLDPSVLGQIDEILGDQVVTDPAYTSSPRRRP
jgi:aryl-alcohol dehydrogenase-like predicted oxidoreductase